MFALTQLTLMLIYTIIRIQLYDTFRRNYMPSFGDRFKQLRKEQNMTQQELADKINKSYNLTFGKSFKFHHDLIFLQ